MLPLSLPDFDLSDERREFRDGVRRFFEEHAPMGEVRRVMESDACSAPELWKHSCDELGLAGLAIPEAHGGQGFGIAELALALGEVGRGLAPVPLFASAGLAARAVAAVADDSDAGEWLTPLASGATATLAWVESPHDWSLRGTKTEVLRVDGKPVLSGHKAFAIDAGAAERFFVVARSPGSSALEGIGLFVVERDAPGLTLEPCESLDPTRSLSILRFDSTPAHCVGEPGTAGAALTRTLEEASVLLSAEMVGGMQRVLEAAVDYANGRFQFGRAIGSFQAIKHKCADMLIAFEAARTATAAAVAAAATGAPDRSVLAAIAKAQCGRAYTQIALENLQIHGGVGYTWEYDAHLYYRRAVSSDALLGEASVHHEKLARELTRPLGAGDGAAKREDTAAEAAFRAGARSWLEANAERIDTASEGARGPRDHGDEAEREFFERGRAWQRTLADGGWAAITWAPEHGGRGGTPAQALIFAEEAAQFDENNGYIDAAVSLIGPSLIRFGTDAQRERYLAPMLRGDEIWCQLFSEPDAGSDLAAVRTRALRDGGEFVINGQKVWTTSAQYADYGFLLARTNPDVPKHKGISFLLVDMRQPGVEVRPLVTMIGDRHFNEVFFEDVRTSADNVVNGVDNGWPVATFVLANEGASIGTSTHGNTSTADLASAALTSGRFDDAHVRQRLGEAYVEERVLELLQARLRDAILDGRRPDIDGSVLKLLWSEGKHRKAELALWLQGADSLLAAGDAPEAGLWQTQLLGRSMGTVGGGTSEVHRNGLGERALGLPREPRLDRDLPFKDLKVSGD